MPILQPVASTSPSISPDGLISAAVRLMPSRTKPAGVQARASASDNPKISVRARTEPERRLSIVPSNVLAGPLTQARGGAPKGQPGVVSLRPWRRRDKRRAQRVMYEVLCQVRGRYSVG